MAMFLTDADLYPFADIDPAKAEAMIADAEAQAAVAAPCLLTLNDIPDPETAAELAHRTAKIAAVKAVLRGAVLRWHEAGNGALQSQTIGPFGQTMDTRVQRRGLFWPSEIEQLQGVCAGESGGAWSIDTFGVSVYHDIACSLNFGATYCSCGADIAGYPIYGVAP
jgi:hypothetical protein